MSRKNLLPSLNSPPGSPQPVSETPVPTESIVEAPQDQFPLRAIMDAAAATKQTRTSPSISAVARSLDKFEERVGRLKTIENLVSEGEAVVELDTELLDPSFVNDRMPTGPNGDSELIDAIRQNGQLNPILVRPNPEIEGRFQIAFGHRRWRAQTALKQKVKAVIRNLTDDELVIAQGQENHERRDLSYIERAVFASRLHQRFDRQTIISAMSTHKGDISIMLSLINKISMEVITEIGPAPGVGRRGWIELSERMAKLPNPTEAVQDVLTNSEFEVASSDERFALILEVFKPRRVYATAANVFSYGGQNIAKTSESEKRIQFVIDRKKSPEFAAFFMEKIEVIFKEFEAKATKPPRPPRTHRELRPQSPTKASGDEAGSETA